MSRRLGGGRRPRLGLLGCLPMAGDAGSRTLAPSAPRKGLFSRWLHSAKEAISPPPVRRAAQPSAADVSDVASNGQVEMTWPSLLMRCWEVTKADSVFAASGEGVILGCIGSLKRAQFDRVAAHVSKAFDVLDGMGQVGKLPEGLCVRFAPEGAWLTAVRISPMDDVVVTIGVIAHYPLIERDRQRLRNTFQRLFEVGE